ncbi:cell-surface hemin receptor [Corynebacterium diphtheriae]|nr:cell-surface hemin receptor [Corynebacterium diphtheriae]CAB0679170.1 cell-surface hemin receptor [Corynebacterium diphtheriae]CAB0945069.1 cell-surface hemin receptor [Corynebacterium diphtheriae]
MLKRFSLPVAAAVAMTGFLVPQVVAEEPAAASQCEMVQVIESGTLKWGVKQSYRRYILNQRLAKGKWTTSSNVVETGDKNSAEFQFEIPVDPAASNIHIVDGKVVNAEINTQNSDVVFTAHHGSLYSELHNPYVITENGKAKAGVSYVAYYVPGKSMTDYKESDRIEKNKLAGRDTFGEGNSVEWTLNDATATLKASNLLYVPKAGTKGDAVEGVDVLFMGQYDGKTNSNLDDVKVDLKLKKVCKDEAEKLKAEYKKNVELASQKAAHSQSGSGTGGESTSTAPTSSTSGFNLSTLWSTILGISGVAALLGILFQVAQKAGWIRF